MLWLLIAATGALVVPVAAVIWVSWRAFTPPREPAGALPDLGTARLADVLIPADGGDLRAWLVRPPGPLKGTVVLLHGWGSHAARMLLWSRFLADGGWASLAMDARGHGRTPGRGPVTLPQLARDLERGVAFVAAEAELGARPIVVLGHSMGGAAVLVALSRGLPARAAVVSSAFARLEMLSDHMLRRWGFPPALFRPLVRRVWGIRTGEPLGDLEPEATIRGLGMPLLLTHGDQDPLIPAGELDRLVRVAPAGTEVLVIPGGLHSDMPEFPLYRERVLEFLSKHASDGVSPGGTRAARAGPSVF